MRVLMIQSDPVFCFCYLDSGFCIQIPKYPTEQLRLMMMDEREDGKTGGREDGPRATTVSPSFLFPLSSF